MQKFHSLLHLCMVTPRNRCRIMDHHHAHRTHPYLSSCHCNDRRRRCRKPVNLHSNLPRILRQHVKNLRCGNTVPARAVDPQGNIPCPGIQLILKKSRRDIIVKPAVLSNYPVHEQNPFLSFLSAFQIYHFLFPVPKLLHQYPSPFQIRQRYRHLAISSYFH